MAIIRCTKKLLSELKAKNGELSQTPNDLNSWHANIFLVERRKCAIFTHDRTLYSFIVTGLTKPDFQNFEEIFRQRLFKSLLAEGLPQRHIETFLEDNRNIEFTKTNNRSVLGSMNELVFHAKYHISAEGGPLTVDIGKLNHYINQMPMSAIDKIFSIYELKRFLEGLEK